MTPYVTSAVQAAAKRPIRLRVARIEPMKFYNGKPCIPWCGSRDDRGYGRMRGTSKTMRAHRAIYENIKGSIPDGLVIDHLCRNPPCVNPDHMDVVPNTINTLRGSGPTAVNKQKTLCKRGHDLSGDNVSSAERGKSGWRVCLKCKCLRAKKYAAEKRASHE